MPVKVLNTPLPAPGVATRLDTRRNQAMMQLYRFPPQKSLWVTSPHSTMLAAGGERRLRLGQAKSRPLAAPYLPQRRLGAPLSHRAWPSAAGFASPPPPSAKPLRLLRTF